MHHFAIMHVRTQALDHTGSTLRQYGVKQAPTAGSIQAQHHSTAKAAHESATARVFEEVMRKGAANPNRLMEAAHLKPFYDGAWCGKHEALLLDSNQVASASSELLTVFYQAPT